MDDSLERVTLQPHGCGSARGAPMRLLSVSPKLIRRLNVCHSRRARVMFRSLAFIQNASAVLLRSVHRRRLGRRLVSFAIILSLFIWPAPGITLKSFEPA